MSAGFVMRESPIPADEKAVTIGIAIVPIPIDVKSGADAMSQSFVVEATYEDGKFVVDSQLPIRDHSRVKITIESQESWVDRTYGLLEWTGDPEILRKAALDPELDPLESA